MWKYGNIQPQRCWLCSSTYLLACPALVFLLDTASMNNLCQLLFSYFFPFNVFGQTQDGKMQNVPAKLHEPCRTLPIGINGFWLTQMNLLSGTPGSILLVLLLDLQDALQDSLQPAGKCDVLWDTPLLASSLWFTMARIMPSQFSYHGHMPGILRLFN